MSHDRIAGIGALVLGAALYTLAGDSESYLFPRNIALGIGALGLAIVAAAVIGMRPPTTATGGTGRTWLKVLPALAVFVAYALTMESLGFYASAFAAFLIIVWIYAREPVSYRLLEDGRHFELTIPRLGKLPGVKFSSLSPTAAQ